MLKNPKTMLLLFAVAPTMMALGCGGGGWWKWAHTAAYHVAELIQTAAALNLI